MAHVNDAKKQAVAEIVSLAKEYPIVAAVNMQGLPARQLQLMREKLRDQCVIRMTKRRLMKVALADLEKDKKGIKDMEPHLKGMPALLFTRENPFTLFKILKKNKSPAPAKGGQEAPKDILIKAGPTPFAPGPIIGELGKFGLKTGVENGKVAVKEDKIVAKEGDVISADLAGLLTRLDIQPMEVGLDITAVYEEGDILLKSVLDIDEDQYIADVMSAAAGAFNLGVNASIFNDVTTPTIISQAASQARNLAVESVWLTSETAEIILGKAQAQMSALASNLPEDVRPAGLVTAAAPAPTQEAAPEASNDAPTEEKKDDDDGEMAAGMGALFG